MLSKAREIVDYRQMLYSLVQSDLRTRYKGSFLGFLWTFVNPLIMLIIYGVVFSNVMRIDIENYYLFVFIGLLPWIYFQSSIQVSASSIITNANLVKKIYFPREILTLSIVIGALINYLLGLVILLIALLVMGVELSMYMMLFPLILLIQTLLTYGLALLVSSLNVFFRDLEHILGLLLMGLFYFTPIIYPADMIPDKYLVYFNLNPLKPILQAYHDIFYYKQLPDIGSLMLILLISIVVFYFGWTVFNKLNKRFAEEV
jgi:lipopolysaccharide transport system permease protein